MNPVPPPQLPTPPPELSSQSNVGGGGGNLVDSILQSIQNGSGADDVPMDTSVTGGFDLLPPPPPAPAAPLSEFAHARQAVLEVHIPRVERLARNVIAGIVHAYEPGIHPSRTVDDVHALEEALAALRSILHESGLGALPIDPTQLSSMTSQQKDAQSPKKDASGARQSNPLTDEKLSSKRVEEVFARVQRRREAADVALNILAHQH